MRAYSLLAPAKVNLYLEIVGDRPDGFHELVMVLQSISLADRVEIRAGSTQNIRLRCDAPDMPEATQNLAYKAAVLMRDRFPAAHAQYGGIEIAIDKQIPIAAGLAGGSSDAAATLVGIDLLWQLGLTQPELQTLAAELGSDVPFCVAGGTAIATGRGEELSSITGPGELAIVLAKPRKLSISTAWAYRTYRAQFGHEYLSSPTQIDARPRKAQAEQLIAATIQGDRKRLGQSLHNDLERVVLPAESAVADLRATFLEQDVLGAMMSGSGPTVFALCASLDRARAVEQTARARHPEADVYVAELSNSGVRMLE